MKKQSVLKKDNDFIFPLNYSENIEFENLNLLNYFNKFKANINELLKINKNYNAFLRYQNNTIDVDDSYKEYIYTDPLIHRDNALDIINDNIIKNDCNYCIINFCCEITSHTPSEKFIKIQIIRDNNVLTEEINSTYVNTRGQINCNFAYRSEKNDEIKIFAYGKTNDVFFRSNLSLNFSYYNRDFMKYL